MQPPPIERLQSLREAVTRVYRPSRGDKCALDRALDGLTLCPTRVAALAEALLQDGCSLRLLAMATVLLSNLCGEAADANELLRAAPTLFQTGLGSPNREVRVRVLALLTRLAPRWTAASGGASPPDLQALLEGALPRLVALLSERSAAPAADAAAEGLRALCRGKGLALCRRWGLAASLDALPLRCRSGAEAGPALADLLLRLGRVGAEVWRWRSCPGRVRDASTASRRRRVGVWRVARRRVRPQLLRERAQQCRTRSERCSVLGRRDGVGERGRRRRRRDEPARASGPSLNNL